MGKAAYWKEKSFLTDEQSREVIMSFLYARGDPGATEEEAALVLEWANGAVLNSTLLHMVLDRKLTVNLVDGELVFKKFPGVSKDEE